MLPGNSGDSQLANRGCHPRLHRRLTCKTWKVLHVRKIGLWYYKYCFWKSWETEMTSWSSWMSPPLNFQKLACQSSVFAPWSSHLLDLICRCHGPVAAIVRPDARSPDARSPPVPICPATARLSGKRLSRRLCLCRRRPSLFLALVHTVSDPTSACRYFPWFRQVRIMFNELAISLPS